MERENAKQAKELLARDNAIDELSQALDKATEGQLTKMLNEREFSDEEEEAEQVEGIVENQTIQKTEQILHRIEEAQSSKQEDSTWEDGASVTAAKEAN